MYLKKSLRDKCLIMIGQSRECETCGDTTKKTAFTDDGLMCMKCYEEYGFAAGDDE